MPFHRGAALHKDSFYNLSSLKSIQSKTSEQYILLFNSAFHKNMFLYMIKPKRLRGAVP